MKEMMNDEIRMTNDELPEGWVSVPFSAITVDPVQRVPAEKENITYIDIGSVDRVTKKVIGPQNMLGKDAPSRARKVVQAGDVLVSTVRPNLNAVALVGSEFDGQFASTGFDVLRSPVVDPRWLFYSVRTPEFLDRMSELVQGALYPAVRSSDIRSFVIPLAPLAEQKRIADKLEAVLGRVDACRARLDRVPDLLKRFRQSVLAAATSGQLTEDWRMTNGVNDKWETSRLGEIAELISGVAFKSELFSPLGDYQVLKIANIKNGYVALSAAPTFIDEKTAEGNLRFKAEYPDILISMTGTKYKQDYGFVGMLPEGRRAWVNQRVAIVRADRNHILPDFLKVFMQSRVFREAFFEGETGQVNQGNVGIGHVAACGVSYPSLTEQAEIVRRVEALFAFADRIEARLTTARAQVERLTPATLAKAFRGELVPQDSNDEPASVLLERLRNQPVAKPAKAKRPNRP